MSYKNVLFDEREIALQNSTAYNAIRYVYAFVLIFLLLASHEWLRYLFAYVKNGSQFSIYISQFSVFLILFTLTVQVIVSLLYSRIRLLQYVIILLGEYILLSALAMVSVLLLQSLGLSAFVVSDLIYNGALIISSVVLGTISGKVIFDSLGYRAEVKKLRDLPNLFVTRILYSLGLSVVLAIAYLLLVAPEIQNQVNNPGVVDGLYTLLSMAVLVSLGLSTSVLVWSRSRYWMHFSLTVIGTWLLALVLILMIRQPSIQVLFGTLPTNPVLVSILNVIGVSLGFGIGVLYARYTNNLIEQITI